MGGFDCFDEVFMRFVKVRFGRIFLNMVGFFIMFLSIYDIYDISLNVNR